MKRAWLEEEPALAPHAESPIQIAPFTSMKLPYGILTVVPALTMSFAPSATSTSPCKFMVPDHVSTPVTVPLVVSLTADAAGRVTRPSREASKNSVTIEKLFAFNFCDMADAPILPMDGPNIILLHDCQFVSIIMG